MRIVIDIFDSALYYNNEDRQRRVSVKALIKLCFGRAFLNSKNRRDEDMYTIYDCVNSFCPLLDTEYYLVLGRKGVPVGNVSFVPKTVKME